MNVVFDSFEKYWEKELRKPKPWLLRALHGSNGLRYLLLIFRSMMLLQLEY
jgi:hypothetical protein